MAASKMRQPLFALYNSSYGGRPALPPGSATGKGRFSLSWPLSLGAHAARAVFKAEHALFYAAAFRSAPRDSGFNRFSYRNGSCAHPAPFRLSDPSPAASLPRFTLALFSLRPSPFALLPPSPLFSLFIFPISDKSEPALCPSNGRPPHLLGIPAAKRANTPRRGGSILIRGTLPLPLSSSAIHSRIPIPVHPPVRPRLRAKGSAVSSRMLLSSLKKENQLYKYTNPIQSVFIRFW